MRKIEWKETKALHTNRPRHTAAVPIALMSDHFVRKHLAFIHQKNDGRWEVTAHQGKPSDLFPEPSWKPTFTQKVFPTLDEAKALVESCWHDEPAQEATV